MMPKIEVFRRYDGRIVVNIMRRHRDGVTRRWIVQHPIVF